ncbi:hypothetical protein BKA64DRAFT_384403 [Cadophora sp. MPI-SDFR-AT-0126]|nr:hypothetical protein BKA64DRAFT_384403 [Leotiomycetes sp. MPI-SDFR-AT-0126]
MTTPRRGRACDICHSIKIKCELGASSSSSPPCERCLRLGKTCSVSAPVRKKDRIAELEAQLEEMTRLLRLQENHDRGVGAEGRMGETSPRTPDLGVRAVRGGGGRGRGNKKRRLSGDDGRDGLTGGRENVEVVLEIDHVVSEEMQRSLMDKYRNEMEPVFPFAVRHGYDVLRARHPLLLQAVIFAACPGVLPIEAQDEVTTIVVKLVAPDEVEKADKTIELLQAILMISFWYRPPKNQVHVAIDRNLNLVISLAQELGISNSECALGIASLEPNDKIDSTEAWRTWHICYLLSSSQGGCMRFPPKIPWDVDMEMKLSSLEYARDSVPSDRLLCQFVRAERLCEQIAVEAGYNTADSTLQVTDHVKIRRIQNLIIDRKAQLFSSNSTPALKLYENIATLYLYECILHTPTNKRSFAAPYVAERLSLTDFPAPIVTPDHIPFLYGLRDACHTALNAILALDYRDIAFAPIVTFTAKAFYAQWLLIKLYVAATATGNTYGAFIDAQSLQIDHYLCRISEVGDRICAMDAEHMGGKGLQLSARKIREWVFNCDVLRAEESLRGFSEAETMAMVVPSGGAGVRFGLEDELAWGAVDYGIEGFEYGLEDLFGVPIV